MDTELDKLLTSKFPFLYSGNRLYIRDKKNPLARAPFEVYGFQCQSGWFDLLSDLSSKLMTILDTLPENKKHSFEVAQVKEKFGGLRYYYSWNENRPSDEICEQIRLLISDAESRSYETCEDCGKTGKKRSGRWLRVLCNTCHSNNKL